MYRYAVAALMAVLAVALLASAADARGKPPPTTVTVVYFYPSDQQPTPGYPLDAIMSDVQGWYSVQVGFTFDVSPAEVIQGLVDTAYYQGNIWGNVLRELGYWCGTGVHVIVVHPSIGFTGGGACSNPDDGGVAIVEEDVFSDTNFFNFNGVVAHELGHAFSLSRSTCESVMLCWWDYPEVGLLDSEIQTLQASPYFGDGEICIPKYNPHGKLVGKCR